MSRIQFPRNSRDKGEHRLQDNTWSKYYTFHFNSIFSNVMAFLFQTFEGGSPSNRDSAQRSAGWSNGRRQRPSRYKIINRNVLFHIFCSVRVSDKPDLRQQTDGAVAEGWSPVAKRIALQADARFRLLLFGHLWCLRGGQWNVHMCCSERTWPSGHFLFFRGQYSSA